MTHESPDRAAAIWVGEPFFMAIAALAFGWATLAGAQSPNIAITGVTLIDGRGAAPVSNVTVLVTGSRISGIDRSGATRVPAGATPVDGRGKFLVPGFWDMHVHIGRYEDGATLLPQLVRYGITGVRDMASPVDDILRLRRESADGSIVAPTIVAAGPILQSPLPFTLPPLVRTVTDADAGPIVDELRAKGVDFIKVGDTLSRAAYFSIAAEAKRLGLPFAGHVPVTVSALEATRAGQRSIEHFGSAGFRNVLIACSTDESALTAYVRDALAAAVAGGPSPDERLYSAAFTSRLADTYDARKASDLFREFVRHGTWHVPTWLALRQVWSGRGRQLSAADSVASERAAMKTLEMFAAMRKAGVRIMAGTDLPASSGMPPLHDELVALVNAGMTPMDALQAATRRPAEFLGRSMTEGTIELGKKANLVLLDGDPLADIANTRHVTAVILAGQLLPGAAR